MPVGLVQSPERPLWNAAVRTTGDVITSRDFLQQRGYVVYVLVATFPSFVAFGKEGAQRLHSEAVASSPPIPPTD